MYRPVWLGYAIVNDFFCLSATAVLGTIVNMQTQDGKYAEDETQEDKDIQEAHQRCHDCVHQQFHCLQFANRFERSEYASCSQRFQESWIEARNEIEQAYEHDSEIELVPRVAQIGVLVTSETHDDDLANTLKQVDEGETSVESVDLPIPLAFEVGVEVARVVARGQQHRVHQDAQRYEVLKPWVNHDLGQEDAKKVILLEAQQTDL